MSLSALYEGFDVWNATVPNSDEKAQTRHLQSYITESEKPPTSVAHTE